MRYVTCEAFTNDFIDALQEKRLEQFKGRYRAYDVLLVDDIQFLAGKQRMQEEFFHTFNTLYESGSQIVLSSDRPPKRHLAARGDGCARASSGASSPTSRRPTWRPASPSC